MHWKRYKGLPAAQKRDDKYYIVGLDIGNDSSGIAFYNLAEGEPELIDLSGGYGRPTVPTVMQYVAESREWVFGEYAILNGTGGRDILIRDLVEKLGNSEYIDIDGRPVSVVFLLGTFIKELLNNIKSINPNAEIAGIVAAIPVYFGAQAREELTRAFKSAGCERELIALVPDRECVFAYHYRGRPRGERSLLIDYGARGVRGGVYETFVDGDAVVVKSISSLFDDTIGTQAINSRVYEMFLGFLTDSREQAHRLNEQLQSYIYQHKDILFKKTIREKPAKLYFNFVYPPLQKVVTSESVEQLIEPYQDAFINFIRDALEKNLYGGGTLAPSDIETVLCVGGGFEMLWTREAAAALFPQSAVKAYKNTKAITAMGAAAMAAHLLGAARGCDITVEDNHRLRADIGIDAKRFIPLAECNSFWWQRHAPRTFIINEPVDGDVPLVIASRTPEGETALITELLIDSLPKRPKGTTRLTASLRFLSDCEAAATFTDCGFGELFPKEDYLREYTIHIG